MSLVFVEGFEMGANLNPATSKNASFAVDQVFSGTYSLKTTGIGYFSLPFTPTPAPCTIMWAARRGTEIRQNRGCRIDIDDGDYWDVYHSDGTGWIKLDLRKNGVVLATTYIKWPESEWGQFAFEMNAGTVRVLWNGEVVVNYIAGGISGNVHSVKLGLLAGSFTDDNWYDDLIVLSETFPGHLRIFSFLPEADDTQGLTRSAGGDNYALVDEEPADDDTTYVSSVADGEDLYDFSITEEITGLRWASIKGVVVSTMSKELSATANQTKGIVQQSAYNYYSNPSDVETYYAHNQHIWDNNPATASAWLEGELTSLVAGVKHEHP